VEVGEVAMGSGGCLDLEDDDMQVGGDRLDLGTYVFMVIISQGTWGCTNRCMIGSAG